MDNRIADFILVGGGLQNALLALLLTHLRRGARVVLIEAEPSIGASHTWCFHEQDLAAAVRTIIEPLIVRTWPAYTVRFPHLQRHVPTAYAALTSECLHAVVTERAASNPDLQLRLGHTVTRVEPSMVHTAAGERWCAPVVVDARGPAHRTSHFAIGYQKFLGLECEVDPITNLREPMLMDANVAQTDGFRFFYVLPLQSDRVLIEDTYYSDTPELKAAELRRSILDYAKHRGIAIARVLREESGILPLPGRMRPPAPLDRRHLKGGYAGGWFHPTTGYSLPLAVKFATEVAMSPLEQLEANLGRLRTDTTRQQRYCVLLNRLLFDGFSPSTRVPVFERFYRMPVSAIQHFYSLQLTAIDRLRLLCGKPPPGLNPRRAILRIREQRVEQTEKGEIP